MSSRYNIHERVGIGSYGDVYRATCIETKEEKEHALNPKAK